MASTTLSSPHLHGPETVSRVMHRVIVALVPAIIGYVWYFGWGVLVNITIACTVALAAEAAMLSLRGRPLGPFLSDGSALVATLLLAIALPPLVPWWIPALGATFAMVFGKHLYGGLGYNPFNPAMVGYVVLLVSFPLEMTTWILPAGFLEHPLGIGDTITYIFAGALPGGLTLDAITMASPLDTMKTGLGMARTVSEISVGPLFGAFGGVAWEVINGLILLGGLWLLWRRVISWHAPVGMLGALFLMSALFHLFAPDTYPGPLFHLASGGAILGAFFIITDPVSGATSPRGRLLFGIGAGLLVYVIRTWGGYPDGVAFAVLLMNMAAPTIDYYTQPRVFGHEG